MLRGMFYYVLASAWLLLCMYNVTFISEYFEISEMSAIINNILIVIGFFFAFGVFIMIFMMGFFDSIQDYMVELRSIPGRIKKFSISSSLLSLKEKLAFLWALTPFILMYVLTPIVLVNFIGAWVFLIFPIWVIGYYVYAENSATKREHMPFLEHTEAIGIMIGVAFPTTLSFVGTLIYYFW